MPTFRRPLLTALLIVLLLSVMSVGVHAAAHASGVVFKSCEFCAGHGEPVGAAPAVATLPLPTRADTGTAVYRYSSVAGSTIVNRRQRAPPVPS